MANEQIKENVGCTWEKVDGKWICQAKQCVQWMEGGSCKLGKVSLTCDNNDCRWNKKIEQYGIYICRGMDAHLDANGKCLGFEKKLK